MRIFVFCILLSISGFAQSPNESSLISENTFAEGMKYFLLENYQKALTLFEAVVKLDDKSATGYYMKSRTETALGKSNLAEISAENAVKYNPQGYYFLENYALVLTKNNKTKEAQKIYKELLKIKPDYISTYFALVDLQLLERESVEALKTLSQIENQFGTSEKITSLKQSILLKENKVDAALKEGNKRMKGNPNFALNQAKILMESEREKEATELLVKTIDANPDFVDGFGMLSELYAKQKDKAASKSLNEKILQTNYFPYSLKVNSIGNYLKVVDNVEDLKLLLANVESLKLQYPKESRTYIYLGDIQFRLRQNIQARNNYREALNLDKNQFEVWLALIQLDFQLANFRALEKDSEDATTYFPNHAVFWLYLALAQLENKHLDDAEISLEEAGRLGNSTNLKEAIQAASSYYALLTEKSEDFKSTTNSELEKYLSTKYLININSASAQTESAKLTADFPQNNEYKFLFANTLFGQKKYAEALKVLDFINAEEQLESTKILNLKGDIYTALGQNEDAKKTWTKVLEIEKNNKTVQEKLNRIK